MADVFAYRTVEVTSGEVTDRARMHAHDSQGLEYPISASLREATVLLTSWFSAPWSAATAAVVTHRRTISE